MKQGFTLLEIIVVIGIIAILIGSVSFFTSNKFDKQIGYGQECSKFIFQEILDEKINIEKGKVLYSGEEILIPVQSEITSTQNEEIEISNKYQNGIKIKRELVSNWFCTTNEINNKDQFKIQVSEWGFQTTIKKDNIIHNEVILNVCDQASCMKISKITYNKAINKFILSFCKVFNWSECNQWEI